MDAVHKQPKGDVLELRVNGAAGDNPLVLIRAVDHQFLDQSVATQHYLIINGHSYNLFQCDGLLRDRSKSGSFQGDSGRYALSMLLKSFPWLGTMR